MKFAGYILKKVVPFFVVSLFFISLILNLVDLFMNISKYLEMNSPAKEVIHVNVDEASELAEQFGVMSIPTLVMMKEGKVVNSFTGYAPKEAIENFIKG